MESDYWTKPPSSNEKTESADTGEVNPWAAGIASRFTALAVTGKLFSNNESITAELAKAGPVGKQLLLRMDDMQSKGWSVGSLSFNDPYLKLESPNWLKRSSRLLTMTGYHFDHYNDVPIRRIAYNNFTGAIGSFAGLNYGIGNPVKHTAGIVAHELAHEDGTLYSHKDWKSLPLAEQQTLAKRLLATETRAILTQLHVGQQIGDMHLSNESLKGALKNGDLGGYIHDTWAKVSDVYGPFKTINRGEASTFVNDYVNETFGKNVVDTKTGRVNAFDINAGTNKQVGFTTFDAEMRAKLMANAEAAHTKGGISERLMSNSGGGAILKGLQIAGAYGMLSQFTDINMAFKAGPVEGIGRTGRVAADWGGMEAGSLGGVALTRAAFSLLPQSRIAMVALPAVSIIGGAVGATVTDKYVGRPVEEFVVGLKKLLG